MTPAGGQTLGVFGFVNLGGVLVSVRTGAQFANPLNWEAPPPIAGNGGYGVVNRAPGFNFPVITVPAIPLDPNSAPPWFTAAFLNALFLTRSARPVWDLGELASLLYSNNGSVNAGRGTWRVYNPKAMGFSIVCRKGQPIQVMMRFAGRNRVKALIGDLPAEGNNGSPFMFDRLSFPSASPFDTSGIVGLTMNFDCGTTPNMELDGTLSPVEQNAGLPSCSITLECNSLDTIAPPGYDPENDTFKEIGGAQFVIAPEATDATKNVTFSLGPLLPNAPYDRSTQVGARAEQLLLPR